MDHLEWTTILLAGFLFVRSLRCVGLSRITLSRSAATSNHATKDGYHHYETKNLILHIFFLLSFLKPLRASDLLASGNLSSDSPPFRLHPDYSQGIPDMQLRRRKEVGSLAYAGHFFAKFSPAPVSGGRLRCS